MFPRYVQGLGVVLALFALHVPNAQAQQSRPRQSLVFNVGYFVTRAEDGRRSDDVLVQNLNFLWFNLSDFNGASIGGDWLIDLGDFLEAGVGVDYRRRTVPSVYADYVDSDGTEIAQDLKLRVTSIPVTVRFLPFGHRNPVQPYVGVGAEILNWRYAETGEFVDFTDGSIFRGNYVDQGRRVGAVALGGVRVPIGDLLALGFEVRYHDGRGQLDSSQGFLGDSVDLSGWTSQATFRVKF